MKKIMFLTVFLAILPLFVFAHGGNRHHTGNNGSYEVCAIENCYAQNIHLHNKQYYAPHKFNDGHFYHEQCQFNDCNYGTVHTHNGYHYFPSR